jgi:hypothetical protein
MYYTSNYDVPFTKCIRGDQLRIKFVSIKRGFYTGTLITLLIDEFLTHWIVFKVEPNDLLEKITVAATATASVCPSEDVGLPF